MNPYIEILRPTNALMAFISVLLMAIIGHTYNYEIILGSLCVFIATGSGNTINDYYDYEIDRINAPNRPIPSGKIELKRALYYSLIFISSINYIRIYNIIRKWYCCNFMYYFNDNLCL